MQATLATCCLLLSLCCNFTGADGLRNFKKVSKVGTLRSDSSDVIRALERKKRHVTEEVVKLRKKRAAFPVSNRDRRILYNIADGLEEDDWKKLVKSDENPFSFTVVKNSLIGGAHGHLEIPIDRSVFGKIFLVVKGDCENLTFSLPNGRNTTMGLHETKNYPAPFETLPRADSFGVWTVSANSNSSEICSVDVRGISTMGFAMSLMTKHTHASDSAYHAIDGNPVMGKSLAVILDGFGMEALKSGPKDVVETVRFVNKSGHHVIDPVQVTDDANGLNSRVKVYLNDGLKTSEPVYVMVEGKDFQGYRFLRTILQPIKPSHVTLKCEPRDVIMQTEVETTFDVTILNDGETDTFTVDVYDTAGFTTRKQEYYTMESKQTSGYPVSVRTTYRTKEGTRSTLTFRVEGTQPGSSQITTCNLVVGKPSNPRIDALTIDGTINSRFAETVMTSTMTNYADIGLEAKFDVLLPVDAFITNLTMTLDDVTVVARVDEKERAKKIYEKAKKRGKTTAHVASRESSTRVFQTSLFVGPGKNVTFRVTYQQLLGRHNGNYKYNVVLNPNQVVKRLKVSVHIEEEEEIDYIHIPFFDQLTSNRELHPSGTSVTFGNRKRSAHIKYNPFPAQQTVFGSQNSFSILYDVVRTKVYGDVTMANGYFAHFYSPAQLPPPPKKVIFIIDKSGSMGTTKMNQAKEAIRAILRSMDESDFFGLIFFDNTPSNRGVGLERATRQHVKKALQVVENVSSGGGTSIIPAFRLGLEEFLHHLKENETTASTDDYGSGDDVDISGDIGLEEEKEKLTNDDYAKMIVFLTDGQGESRSAILKYVKKHNPHQLAIHTIAFGLGAARDLLQSLAAAHDGTYRRIFAGLTAAAQIKDFFQEIVSASGALHNISVTYPFNRIADVTKTSFRAVGSNSEFVWAGRIKEDEELLDVELDEPLMDDFDVSSGGNAFINAHISASYLGEDLDIDVPINPKKMTSHITTSQHQIANFTERLWAFLKIQELLRELVLAKGNPNATALIKEKTLNMSLKYNFVTPLTSMVVVLPEDLKEIEEDLKNEESERKERIKAENALRKEENKRRQEEKKRRQEKERQKLLEALKAKQHLRGSNLQTHSTSARGHGRSHGGGGGGGRGGGYGDPHFVIPLRPGMNLCFNWDGEEGEVYNLLHDPSFGVSVNGQLVRTEAPKETGRSHRTYMSVLGFILSKHDLKILIRPNTVTLISEGMKNITLSVLSPMMITRHGVRLRMYDVKFKTAKIELSSRDWSFDIFVTRNIHNQHQAHHVDFFVDRYKHRLESPLSGIIGQFLDSDVSVAHDNKLDRTIMTINNRSGRVTTMEREQPWSGEKVTCWSSHGNARDIIRGSHEHYLVDDVLKTPKFHWI